MTRFSTSLQRKMEHAFECIRRIAPIHRTQTFPTRAELQFRHCWLDPLAEVDRLYDAAPKRPCRRETDDEFSWSNARHLPDANAQEGSRMPMTIR
jgi:hypothetical protein